MIGRVATFSEVNYLMTLNMGTQAQMTQAQTQESSGLKSLTYGGLSEDVGKVLNLNNQITSLTADKDDATQALSGMQETYSVLGNVTTLGSDMLSTLTSYMNGSTTSTSAVATAAATWMTELTNLANTQYGGAYLFSGSTPNTAAVDTTDYSPTGEVADTSYYQGSDTGSTYTGSDGFQVSTSVQANSSGFENLFRAISMIAQASASGQATGSSGAISSSLDATLTTAYNLMQTGNSELAETQATVSSNTAALTAYQSNATDKITTLQTLSTSLTGSDIASVTVQVTTLQTQLESSYETVTKLMSDSLAKYIS